LEVVAIAKRKTTTSTEVKRRYNEKTYTRIVADIPKEKAAKFKEKCELTGISQRQVVINAIDDFLGDD